jgi:hypothetical protein
MTNSPAAIQKIQHPPLANPQPISIPTNQLLDALRAKWVLCHSLNSRKRN